MACGALSQVGDVGVMAISEALRGNIALETLNLTHANIHERGAMVRVCARTLRSTPIAGHVLRAGRTDSTLRAIATTMDSPEVLRCSNGPKGLFEQATSNGMGTECVHSPHIGHARILTTPTRRIAAGPARAAQSAQLMGELTAQVEVQL